MTQLHPVSGTPDQGLRRYDAAAAQTARLVLRTYSTSFGWATRLLAQDLRPHIAAIYGLVRVADEIVDGPAHAAGLDTCARRALLDHLEGEVAMARSGGYSSNLIVHAFARTANQFDIGEDLIEPFFASLRADLTLVRCTQAEFDQYVYGSAEVIGLMCLRVFVKGRGHDGPAQRHQVADLEKGARSLGAAFQKINFLRDLGEDTVVLGRSYFPGVVNGVLDEDQKTKIISSIHADLDAAESAIRLLPRGARPAVTTAWRLFAELTDRLERVAASQLIEKRIRVPNLIKARIVARALFESRCGT